MKTKLLIIAVIEKENAILMRKKPMGSKPYNETWYIFGAEVETGIDPETSLINYLNTAIGIEVSIEGHLGWASEIKEDLDGEIKQFIYLDTLCRYISGEPKLPSGAEKIERINKDNLKDYDIVPPSIELFKKLKYL